METLIGFHVKPEINTFPIIPRYPFLSVLSLFFHFFTSRSTAGVNFISAFCVFIADQSNDREL